MVWETELGRLDPERGWQVADNLVEVIALILLPVAVLMCAYALTVFVWRSRAISKKTVCTCAARGLPRAGAPAGLKTAGRSGHVQMLPKRFCVPACGAVAVSHPCQPSKALADRLLAWASTPGARPLVHSNAISCEFAWCSWCSSMEQALAGWVRDPCRGRPGRASACRHP